MSTSCLPETAAPAVAVPASAAAEMRAKLWARRWRTMLLLVPLCLGISLLLTSMGGRFWSNTAYSFAIGISCQTIIDGTRLTAAYLRDRLLAWRRLQRGPTPRSERIDRWLSGWHIAIAATVLAVVIGPAVGLTLGDWMTGLQSPSLLRLDRPDTRLTLFMTVFGSVFGVFVFANIERLTTARALTEAAQRQAAENQLRLLQTQLEPHMLFNTLANLRVLIGLDPQRAQAMLDHLIAFLRTTLQASQANTQPLSTEFKHLADYLALMAVRMGPRLQVQLDLPDALRAVPVPPLLLQPLVENSIQHGLEPKVEGGRIAVQARREADTLVLTVRDTGIGLGAAAQKAAAEPTPEAPGGFGLRGARERLHTLHGGRANLTFEDAADAEGGTLATIRLPLAAQEHNAKSTQP